MAQFFKRFLHKELQRHVKIRNDVADDREYDFRHEVRGIAIVISNGVFSPDTGSVTEPRSYAEEELCKMREMFSGLGFIVMLFKDLTARQMHDVIQTVTSQEMDFFLEKSDAFACVLASHGNEIQEDSPADPAVKVFHHIIYGTDRAIRTHLLVDLLHDNRCKKLQGKPKLFFIQACRSRFNDPNRFDSGVKILTSNKRRIPEVGHDKKESISINSTTSFADTKSPISDGLCGDKIKDGGRKSDGSESSIEVIPCLEVLHEVTHDVSEDPSIAQRGIKWIKKLVFRKVDRIARNDVHDEDTMTTVMTPCHNDFLVMYSTSQGKASFGREEKGGWMIHVMHRIMVQHVEFIQKDKENCLDFLSVMTNVMRHIGFYFETDTGNPNTSGYKAAPTLQHKLSKDLIFRNKYVS
ncbi:uncharacterized protein LOC125669447 isoform X2 [Ostrea edulis]|nr:uncharacterized protein LOC125669447 isoform X2 [Ostrea edulis]